MADALPGARRRTAILASGRGSNARALLEAWRAGRLPACEIVAVVCNIPDAPVLAVARRFDVPAFMIPHADTSREEHERRVIEALRETRAEFLVLAGYLRVLSPAFVAAWPHRILNIHPSLLPAYPGLRAIERALADGGAETGCTVHVVTVPVDGGPIVAQETVPILLDDTADSLSARVHAAEHRLLPRVVDLLTRGRIEIEGARVTILGEDGAPATGADSGTASSGPG